MRVECFKEFHSSPKDSGLKGTELIKFMLSHENLKATCNMLIKMFEEQNELMYSVVEQTQEGGGGDTPTENTH